MRYEVRIDVTHLPGVLDPQGATVERALPALGYDNVSEVSIAKTIRLALDAPSESRRARPGRRDVPQLLANPVIERYTSSSARRVGGGSVVSARVGVVVFPGTNCELDVSWAIEELGGEAELLWHGERSVRGVDAVVVPGGFAHGDYLRTGAIARFSPVMDAVAEHAAAGGPVVGICNGFQVLTEAGLLPGALQKNTGLTFVCDTVELEVVSTRSVLTHLADGRARGCASRSTTSRATTSATPTRCARSTTTTASSCATSTTPTAASTTSPASATRPATSSGYAPPRARLERPARERRRRACCSIVPRGGRRRVDAASSAGSGAREMPAFFSTSAGTPSSRQAAYEMPLRSAYFAAVFTNSRLRAPTGRPSCPWSRARAAGPCAPGRAAAAAGPSPRRTTVDGGEALLDRIRGAPAAPLGPVLLQGLEVVLDRSALGRPSASAALCSAVIVRFPGLAMIVPPLISHAAPYGFIRFYHPRTSFRHNAGSTCWPSFGKGPLDYDAPDS